MFEDISAHVLDIAWNSIAAGAGRIGVTIRKYGTGFVELEISDDGKGMDAGQLSKAASPFYTSRAARRTGLGLPFLKQNAELCGGKFEISSAPGKGTRVWATFALDNINTPPIGDMGGAFVALMIGAPKARWIFKFRSEENLFELDSEDVTEAIGGLEFLSVPRVGMGLKSIIEKGVR